MRLFLMGTPKKLHKLLLVLGGSIALVDNFGKTTLFADQTIDRFIEGHCKPHGINARHDTGYL